MSCGVVCVEKRLWTECLADVKHFAMDVVCCRMGREEVTDRMLVLLSGFADLHLRSGHGVLRACQTADGGCCHGVFLGRHRDAAAGTGIRSAQLAPPADRCQSPRSAGALLHLVGFRVVCAVCPSVSAWVEEKKTPFDVFRIKLLTNFTKEFPFVV